MLQITVRRTARPLLLSSLPVLLLAALFVAAAPAAFAQKAAAADKTAAAAAAVAGDKDAPPYREYKGIRIGMTAADARTKLGAPSDKSDKQDFYTFADGKEMAQVFYDAEKKVYAVSVIYMGAGEGVPAAKNVLGDEPEAKPDGSVHRRVDYPKAGFWVSYSRTPGDSPMVTVTMQKKM